MNFNLQKLETTDGYNISQFNHNVDVIDEEMNKPPLTVNDVSPDEDRNIQIDVVPLADNLTSDEAQLNTGVYIIRSSGGEASISNGSAWLSTIKGGMVKSGAVAESIQLSVVLEDPTSSDPITASVDRDTFVAEVSNSGTYTFTYTTAWSDTLSDYGISVSGTPVSGDQIVIVYVKSNRGTIATATPNSFVSTGWNLYNHAVGYARVTKYSEEYGFKVDGTYTGLKFAETLDGEQETITPVDGFFTVPADGYVFVYGGNATDTEIWMTWSDWTEEANGGTFEAYSQTAIDLTGVMANFPNGLMRVGTVFDEINLNVSKAYSRIQRLQYTEENLAAVIASGVDYDTDTGYIYAVKTEPATYNISLDGEYTVSDHGEEMFTGTSAPLTASSLYGNDLKNKLRRDVLTISEQALTDAQKSQVHQNIGLVPTVMADITTPGYVADGRAIRSLNKYMLSIEWTPNGTTLLDFLNANCDPNHLPFSFIKKGSTTVSDSPFTSQEFIGEVTGCGDRMYINVRGYGGSGGQEYYRGIFRGAWLGEWRNIDSWRMYQVKEYSKTYSLSNGSSLSLTANDFQISTPSGYTPLAIAGISSGDDAVFMSNVSPRATGTNVAMVLFNNSGSDITSKTARLHILYMQS